MAYAPSSLILAKHFTFISKALGIKGSMESELKVGDWVRSYGSGIWRINRILELNDFDIPSQSYKPRTAIFSSRFVNDSFKRSFSTESCDSAFVSHLEPEEKEKLDSYIKGNKLDTHLKFCTFRS